MDYIRILVKSKKGTQLALSSWRMAYQGFLPTTIKPCGRETETVDKISYFCGLLVKS
jgi:hypothetical protein